MQFGQYSFGIVEPADEWQLLLSRLMMAVPRRMQASNSSKTRPGFLSRTPSQTRIRNNFECKQLFLLAEVL